MRSFPKFQCLALSEAQTVQAAHGTDDTVWSNVTAVLDFTYTNPYPEPTTSSYTTALINGLLV